MVICPGVGSRVGVGVGVSAGTGVSVGTSAGVSVAIGMSVGISVGISVGDFGWYFGWDFGWDFSGNFCWYVGWYVGRRLILLRGGKKWNSCRRTSYTFEGAKKKEQDQEEDDCRAVSAPGVDCSHARSFQRQRNAANRRGASPPNDGKDFRHNRMQST